jgi:DnaJ-domain-containing protein 1
MTTANPPDFLTIFWHSPDRANLCTLTLLAWLAGSDGTIAPSEEALLRRFAVAGNAGEIDTILAVARAGSIDALEVVCRYAMTRMSRGRKRLLAQLAVTVAAADKHITVGENYVLQFLADLLGISPRSFAKLFEQVTHRPFPEAGDPSSIGWWQRREAGVEAEPAQDLPPDSAEDVRRDAEASARTAESRRATPAVELPTGEMTRVRAWAILNLAEGASAGEVRSAFRRLAKVRHPDRYVKLGPAAVAAATEAFKQLEAAYSLVKGAA